MTVKPQKFSNAAKIDELYRRGILAPWKLHSGQKLMYAAIQAATGTRFVVNAARRLGKSYMLVVIALEYAFQHPNSQIKYAAPNQKMARKIVFPLFRQILEDCPKHLRPVFKVHDGEFQFSNGATITVCGTEMGQVDGLRGTACDLALLDECGFMHDLRYVIDSVLTPQFLTRPNARMILASTPPVSPDHAFVSHYMQMAMEQGSYAKFDIHSNPLLTPQQIADFCKEAGGADSTTWRREYLAEIVTETENALFPEATQGDLLDRLVYDLPTPKFFVPLTAVDLGYLDFTGVVFGYYDFVRAKVVIQDELLFNGKNTAEIVALIFAKEKELWGTRKPPVRIVDGNSLAIADLNSATYKFPCRVPEKNDLASSINRVRIDLAMERIVFNSKCKNTVAQVRYGTWDSTRTKFSRSSSGGHFDLAAALIYFTRHLNRHTNPFPASEGYDPYDDFGFPRQHKNSAVNAIKTMFRPTLK